MIVTKALPTSDIDPCLLHLLFIALKRILPPRELDMIIDMVDKSTLYIFPKGITTIKESTFSDCFDLQEVNIPESVTTIGDNAFSGCSSLREVNIPDGVTIIGKNVFDGCSSLMKVNIPESVTRIGSYAFWA